MNALEIFSEGVGSTVYYGPGAGPEPTASAVLADLVDIAKGGWEVDITNNKLYKLELPDNKKSAYYYRLNVKDEPGVIAKITSLFGKKDISIDALIQHESREKEHIDFVPLVIISGEISDIDAIKLKTSLEKLPEVSLGIKKFRIHSGQK